MRDAVWAELAEWVCYEDKAFPRQMYANADRDAGPSLPEVVASRSQVTGELAALRAAFEQAPPANPTDTRDIDPLGYWKMLVENGRCTSVAHLARIVLSVPATSAASEREFSNSGSFTTANRSKLSVDKVEMITVVRSTIKAMGARAWLDWIRGKLADERARKRQQIAT